MFVNQNLAMRTGEQFAAEQRIREIAKTGHSNIQLLSTPKKKKSKGTLRESLRRIRGVSDATSVASVVSASSASMSGTPLSARRSPVPTLLNAPPLPLDISSNGSEEFSVSSDQPHLQFQSMARSSNNNLPGGSSSVRSIASLGSIISGMSISNMDNTNVNVTSSTSNQNTWISRRHDKLDLAIGRISNALDLQQEQLQAIEKRIMHHVHLANARYGNSTTIIGVCLSLRNAHELQREYIQIFKIVVALQELRVNVASGIELPLETIDSFIVDIVRTKKQQTSCDAPEVTDEVLIHELQMHQHDLSWYVPKKEDVMALIQEQAEHRMIHAELRRSQPRPRSRSRPRRSAHHQSRLKSVSLTSSSSTMVTEDDCTSAPSTPVRAKRRPGSTSTASPSFQDQQHLESDPRASSVRGRSKSLFRK